MCGRMLLEILNGFQKVACHVPPENKKDYDDDDHSRQPDTQVNQSRFLFAFDGGDDGCAAFGADPRMVADLSAAFVALDEGHISS